METSVILLYLGQAKLEKDATLTPKVLRNHSLPARTSSSQKSKTTKSLETLKSPFLSITNFEEIN